MKTLVLIGCLLSANIFAADYQRHSSSFTISTFANGGTRVFYNCDSVENRVTHMLKQMGAHVLSVRCTGGLDRWGAGMHLPASVRVTYDTLSSKIDGNVATVVGETQIKQRDNCHLNNAIFKGVRHNFEIYKQNQKRCLRPGDRTLIDLSLLLAK